METLARCIRRNGMFLRRRDLLARGYSDEEIRSALGESLIFRVRQGWYSVPDAPPEAIRAVRVGGRLTGLSALESYGLRVPRRAEACIAVPVGSCRLRAPDDRRSRLGDAAGVIVLWSDAQRAAHRSPWRVSISSALVSVLEHESRDIAVACASAVLRHKKMSELQVDAAFRQAPQRARAWRALVNRLDDSHGETFARLWLGDAGYIFESQPHVAGVGRLDGRVSPHVYIEIDGAQHDPSWTGGTPSSYESDRDRDVAMVTRSNGTIRFTYRQLYGYWPECLAAVAQAVADDAELVALRLRHPRPKRAFETFHVPPKRRRSRAKGRDTGNSPSP